VQHKNVNQNSKSTNLFPIAINDSNNKASKWVRFSNFDFYFNAKNAV
jgi:hypothetical protein